MSNDCVSLARERIKKYLKQKGKFTHNTISAVLRQVADECGYDEANKLVDEFKLTKKFGIEKHKVV